MVVVRLTSFWALSFRTPLPARRLDAVDEGQRFAVVGLWLGCASPCTMELCTVMNDR